MALLSPAYLLGFLIEVFFFFSFHIRVIVSEVLLHQSVTGHHRKMNLWFASSDCPVCLPSDAINTKTETQPTLGQNIQNNSCNGSKHSRAQLDPLTSDFSGSTLAFSSDEKAVLVRFLSPVPAELRGEERNALYVPLESSSLGGRLQVTKSLSSTPCFTLFKKCCLYVA